jgi:hypothetical protein
MPQSPICRRSSSALASASTRTRWGSRRRRARSQASSQASSLMEFFLRGQPSCQRNAKPADHAPVRGRQAAPSTCWQPRRSLRQQVAVVELLDRRRGAIDGAAAFHVPVARERRPGRRRWGVAHPPRSDPYGWVGCVRPAAFRRRVALRLATRRWSALATATLTRRKGVKKNAPPRGRGNSFLLTPRSLRGSAASAAEEQEP